MTATATKAPVSSASPLTGKELLARQESLAKEGADLSSIAIECGYYSTISGGPREGCTRANTTQFQEALLAAQGFTFHRKQSRPSSASRLKVNGKRMNVTVPATLVAKLDVTPGDVFVPSVDVEAGTITLALAD